MRTGYNFGTLTSVDMKEYIRIGGKVIQIYEGVIIREIFRVNPFKKFFGNLFEFKNYYKDRADDVMELLVKLLMNSLYGEQIRRDIDEIMFLSQKYKCWQNMKRGL